MRCLCHQQPEAGLCDARASMHQRHIHRCVNEESLTISFLIGSSLFPPLLRVVPTSGATKSCHPLRFAPPAFDSQQAPGPGERGFPTPSFLRRAGDGGGRAGAPGGSGGARLPGAQGAGALPLGRPPQQQAACPSRPRQPGLGAPLSPAVASAAPPDMRLVSAFWRRRLLPPGGVRCVRWFRSTRLLQHTSLLHRASGSVGMSANVCASRWRGAVLWTEAQNRSSRLLPVHFLGSLPWLKFTFT